MPSYCCVSTCSNTSRNTISQGVSYHSFPKKNLCRAEEWLAKCKGSARISIKSARVCNEHFRKCDYIDDMRNRHPGQPKRNLLKPDAVPSLKLPHSQNISKTVGESPGTIRNNKWDILNRASHTLKNCSCQKGQVDETPLLQFGNKPRELSEGPACENNDECNKRPGTEYEPEEKENIKNEYGEFNGRFGNKRKYEYCNEGHGNESKYECCNEGHGNESKYECCNEGLGSESKYLYLNDGFGNERKYEFCNQGLGNERKYKHCNEGHGNEIKYEYCSEGLGNYNGYMECNERPDMKMIRIESKDWI